MLRELLLQMSWLLVMKILFADGVCFETCFAFNNGLSRLLKLPYNALQSTLVTSCVATD